MTKPGLIIACPGERFFGDIQALAARLFGVDNVLTFDSYGELGERLARLIPRGGYEFILIAGHGQMDENTGAPVMLSRLTPVQWHQLVNTMVGRGVTAPVVILDGCKSAAFLPIFTRLVGDNGSVVCNVGDSSTTVFGQLEPGRALADAIEAKRQLELAIRPRPGRPLIAEVPDGASEYSDGQPLVWTGARWEFLAFPRQAIVPAIDPKLPAWLEAPVNSAALLATAQAARGRLPRWSATLFVPTAIYTANSLYISGPFASYPEDLLTAYEHWQRYGPGGEALMVERQEINRLIDVLDTAQIRTYDLGLAARVAAIPGQVNAMAPLPRRPRMVRPTVL